MLIRMKSRAFIAALVLLLVSVPGLKAQTDGTYSGFSPYSIYGVGQLHNPGTAWNRGMGGVGIAARTKRFVNVMNPAAMTCRDSLSVLADFGLSARFSYFSEGDAHMVKNLMNINDFVLSFPMWRHSAIYAGLSPMSDTGYYISYNESDGYTGTRNFTSMGNGGLYNMYAGTAVTLWDRLSLGVEYNYIFGNVNKSAATTFVDDSYRNVNVGDSLQIHSHSFKAGLQYEQPLPRRTRMTFGATYKLSTRASGDVIHYRELGNYDRTRSVSDVASKNLRFGDELGLGLSIRSGERWMAEFDYTRTDWTRSNMDNISGFSSSGESVFASSVGQSFRAGFEFTPNRNDIRYYFKRCTYRGGAYFEQSHYTVNGAHVNAIGITLGMTLPVFRGYNGLTVGLDMGRRGFGTNPVTENYLGVNLGFNIFDIWFLKHRYE